MVQDNKINEPFIRPIPLKYLTMVSALSGSSLKVFLYLWYLSGVTKQKKNLKVSYKQAEQFGLIPRSISRGLLELEKQKIVKSSRGLGKSPRVTLLLDSSK